jgi:hypothetical protein
MSAGPRQVRAYVNAHGVDVPEGATALDAVRAWNADEADAVARGERVITDSRGLPIAGDAAVHAGSIFRLVSGRTGQTRPASSDHH